MSLEEQRARDRQRYLANRETILANNRARYHRNLDKEHARGRSYRQRNKEKIAARAKAHRNKEKDCEHSRRYYRENKAKISAKQKAYRKDPANRLRIIAKKREAYWRGRDRYYKTFEWQVERVARKQAKMRAFQRLQRKQLSGYYIRRLLCRGTNLKPEDFSPEIVRLARAKLRLLRAVRNNKQKEYQVR